MTASQPDPLATAIEALTALAPSIAKANETEPPLDFGNTMCRVITAVAANVGSVEALVAGNPISREADLLRHIVDCTAGTDREELLRFRTEPIRLHVDVEESFYHFGVHALYKEERHEAANDPTLGHAIDGLWEQDKRAYQEAYTATLRKRLAERTTAVHAELVSREDQECTWSIYTGILHDEAEELTPLPMTGKVPEFRYGTPADALRRAGLTYSARARAALESADQ